MINTGFARASRLLRWFVAPLERHPEVRNELIATVIQRRPAVFISCAAIMIMSVSAALLTEEAWALAWLAADAALVSYRLYLSFRYDNGEQDPTQGRAAVVGSMLALFLIFGLGCSLCISGGPTVLMLMALVSVLGVFAGIASRWAAFPRLALATVAAIAVPVCLAISARMEGGLTLAAVQFAAIALMTCSQTVQNHRTLMRMVLAEHQNAFLARSDSLTGLGNRVRLREDFAARWSAAPALARANAPSALLYLDLDGFKAFNDAHGHEAGDQLLCKIGQAICVEAEGARVYRIGGDEFVLLCPPQDERATIRLAQRIVDAVAAVRLHEWSARSSVNVSVGIAVAGPEDEPEEVLARADAALYAAKRAGKARYCLAGAPPAVAPLAA